MIDAQYENIHRRAIGELLLRRPGIERILKGESLYYHSEAMIVNDAAEERTAPVEVAEYCAHGNENYTSKRAGSYSGSAPAALCGRCRLPVLQAARFACILIAWCCGIRQIT